MDLGSISGGKIPLDEASLSGDFLTESAKRFQADSELIKRLWHLLLPLAITCKMQDNMSRVTSQPAVLYYHRVPS